ncbi:MAG: hypothetical protein JOY99_12090 [Sphingomonadaceae bacterium]|nr:hypothetical protein [Sphingomonadaceae bacterium]
MSPVLADVVGLIGSACIVGAYAYSNIAKSIDFLLFNIVNFAGAVLLCISLTVHFNLASMVLEFVWMGVALFGIGKAVAARMRA